MSELEEKLNTVLSNPQMMEKIMGLASSLSAGSDEKPSAPPETPAIDPAAISAIGSLLGQSGIDSQEQGLLKALQPYLSRDRISKLERAMHAARMANMASSFLNSGALKSIGRR